MESHRFIHFREIIHKGIIKYSKEILLIKQVHTFQYNDSFNGHRKHFVLLLKFYTSTKISIFRSQFHFRTFKDDIYCKYGGISIFDIKHGQLQETKSDCITRVDDQLYLQPYYSKSNETIIVIYSYPCYSKLSVLPQYFMELLSCCGNKYMCYKDMCLKFKTVFNSVGRARSKHKSRKKESI